MLNGLSLFLLLSGILWALTTSVRMWLGAWHRWQTGQPVLPHEPRRLACWGLLDVLGAVVLLVLLQAVVFACLPPAQRPAAGIALEALPSHQRSGVLAASIIGELAAVAISLALVKLRCRATWPDLGINTKRFVADLRLGAAAFLMLAPPVYLVQMVLVYWFPSQHPLIVAIKKDPDPLFLLLSGVMAVIVAPVAEEYFFRLLLQGWCERIATAGADLLTLFLGDGASPDRPATATPSAAPSEIPEAPQPLVEASNPYASLQTAEAPSLSSPEAPDSIVEAEAVAAPSVWPIALSAGLFAAMHASHGPDPIPLFLLAAGLGYLYQQTHRILPCMIVHFLLNSCSLVMLLVEVLSGTS